MKNTIGEICVLWGVLVVSGIGGCRSERIDSDAEIEDALSDEKIWAQASSSDTMEAYKRYLRLHTDGKHVVEAENKLELLHWKEAVASNTVQGLDRYLQRYNNGIFADEALNKRELLFWREAAEQNTILALNDYIDTYSDGQFVQEANDKIALLRDDKAPYEAAIRGGTEFSLNQFLIKYPGHKKEKEMTRVLAEWQKSKAQDTAAGYRTFIRKYKKYASMADDNIRRKISTAACQDKKRIFNDIRGVLSKTLKNELMAAYGGCINATHFCATCGEPAVGWCHMRNIYVCEKHRYFTQGGVHWRCP